MEDPPEEKPPEEGFPLGSKVPIVTAEVIIDKNLTFDEASRCLNTLGKDESGVRYAYLMLSAFDQKLTNIEVILNFKHLLFVDVSGNYLNTDSLQVLSQMPFVIYIKAQRNRIESACLNPMPYLQVLILSRNRITETCDINQPMLQCLDLNYNLIFTPQFDKERLECIKQIEMRGNSMFDLSGTFPDNLENLYLAENHITIFIENDMAKLTNLKILHLRDNQIRKLNGFTRDMVNLTYLNLRKNQINKIRQFRKLACLPALETLIYSENPVAGELKPPGGGGEDDEGGEEVEGEGGAVEDPTRVPVLVLLPNLKRINKLPVGFEEKEEAFETKDKKYEEIMNEESSEDEVEPPTTTDFTTDYNTTTADLEDYDDV
ncbi:leucine-rich repeat-containing protein 23-like isoform X1 [Onthophagus taurus]|uniref:leucine-rich repeat-containing protein 23-like isoform X1 n=2 Tax=Onthophagus taurus TaxID=166361 RepID=UPI0039BEB965